MLIVGESHTLGNKSSELQMMQMVASRVKIMADLCSDLERAIPNAGKHPLLPLQG